MTPMEDWEREIDGFSYLPLDPDVSPEYWDDPVFSTPGRAEAMWLAGFQPVNAAVWYRAGCTSLGDENADPEDVAREASRWRVLDFEPEDVSAWRQVLDGRVEERLPNEPLPQRAMAWRRAGFDPDSASPWLSNYRGYRAQELELAATMARQGWNPADGSLLLHLSRRLDTQGADDLDWRVRWVETGLTPCQVLCFVKAGADPEEGKTLASWRDQMHLVEELRARDLELPPHDEDVAEAVNDIVWLATDGEETDVPFCREHLPDWHDEPEDPWCPGTGKDGGFIPSVGDEWNIRCPDCRAMWAGGSIVPEHRAR